MVKELRERTGAGIMDCKVALTENDGSMEAAVEYIKKKGLAKAAKKAGAIATEGVVDAYIHPGGRVGVLAEVNCQTDFVARSPDFKAFVDLVGMQIAAMSAQFTRREEVPAADVARQRELFRAQLEEEGKQSGKPKPPAAIDKIIEGKLDKWLSESCLDEQPTVTDADKTIATLASELSAKLGEKITVRRFVRFELGEGLEKKSADLAADVQAAIAGS
jgi:elongation factor Ts